ncbi:maleylpyruvate isomerase family mycothiol-dependent enzyme [Nakamurella lactea]|uniref:maleylpyruvate isomerase family mycothiol-dependent enzyme n=1 Tax=Nakamurella lactea TaxID=459515 RepID=UPI0004014AFC|nr:maleylpyruvate isomerase family mycothiol-dependent enzyme [Nakamurella lactea]
MADTEYTEELYRQTVAERQRHADLLRDLDPADWSAASLCDRWRIREVVAHINATATQTYEQFLAAVEQADGDINLACDRTARSDAERFSDAELLATQQLRVASRWTPGPGNQQGALAHEVIHGLDITVPLGLPAPEPQVLAAAVAGGDPASYAFFGVDLTGLQLVAEDADLTVGTGQTVRLPARDIVLIVTGRRPVPQLQGTMAG